MNLFGFDSPNLIPNIVIGVVVFLLILLALRELRTWYWKINDILALLEKIEKNTRRDAVLDPAIHEKVLPISEVGIKSPSFNVKKVIDPKVFYLGVRVVLVAITTVGIYFLATKVIAYTQTGRW